VRRCAQRFPTLWPWSSLVSRSGSLWARRLTISPEAALLLHRTKMLFEFPDEFFYPPHGVIIRRLSRQSLVSSDLSFELFPVFFSIHES
jgi:hypothetical protein